MTMKCTGPLSNEYLMHISAELRGGSSKAVRSNTLVERSPSRGAAVGSSGSPSQVLSCKPGTIMLHDHVTTGSLTIHLDPKCNLIIADI